MSNAVRGKVTTLYANENGCYIAIDATPKPKSGLFWLPTSHPNYNSLYSLAVVAYVNDYDLQVRNKNNIVSTDHGSIQYVTIDK